MNTAITYKWPNLIRLSLIAIACIALAVGAYHISYRTVVMAIPYWYRWFDDGASQTIGRYRIGVDYPWWIHGKDKDSIALYRPVGANSEDVIAVRLVWDPNHHVRIGDSSQVGYTVLKVQRKLSDKAQIVVKRLRTDLVIFVSCADSDISCVKRASTIETKIEIDVEQ